jgi:Flp pilus assembly protein TadG
VLFGIVEFARAFNAYNDLNQMAANGARFASVGRYPGDASLRTSEADTASARNATLLVTYTPTTCVVGGTVKVTASAPASLSKVLKLTGPPVTLTGSAEMRVERCP